MIKKLLAKPRSNPSICHPKLTNEPKGSPPLRVSSLVPQNPKLSPKFILKTSKTTTNAPLMFDVLKSDGEKVQNKTFTYVTPRDLSTSSLIAKTMSWSRVSPNEIPVVFMKKCNSCSGFVDFSDTQKDSDLKILKFDTLEQILEVLSSPISAKRLNQDCVLSLFSMFCSNVFRPVPTLADMNPNDVAYDAEWVHLEIVYKIFIQLIDSQSIRQSHIQSFLNTHFISGVFNLIRTPDSREQKSICDLLFSIFDRFNSLRKIIYDFSEFYLSISSEETALQYSMPIFLGFLYDTFQISRPADVRQFYLYYLMPLHLHKYYGLYQPALCKIILAVISKDHCQIETFLLYLLHRWPITNSNKQSQYLKAVETVTEKYYKYVSFNTAKLLLKRISSMFSDYTSTLSQQSLFLITSIGIHSIITTNPEQLSEFIYYSALLSSKNHWLESTRAMAFDTMIALERINPLLKMFPDNYCENNIKERKLKWDLIISIAENSMENNIEIPPLSIKDTHSVRRKPSSAR